MISCAQAVRQLWEYLDGAAGQAQSAAIEEHLSACKRCCGEAEFAGELRTFLAAHADRDIAPQVHARLLTALSQIADQP